MTTALEGGEVSVTLRPLFTPGNDPVRIVQEAGCTPGPVWTVAENLTPTGIRSTDRPARSQSLYRLSYPAHSAKVKNDEILVVAFMACRERFVYTQSLKETKTFVAAVQRGGSVGCSF